MTKFPRRETITYERTSTVAINDTIIGNDFDTVEGDREVAANEVFEVERIEVIDPPQNADGSIQEVDWIRLHDGDDYYPNLRFRFFMLGHLGPNYGVTTPRLGQPVLENKVDAERRPLATACPKFGPEDQVNIALENNGTAIDDSFSIRVHGWRFKGTSTEMRNYFSRASNLRTTYNQTITMSNPFTEDSNEYEQTGPIQIRPGDPGAHRQFTRLTGGNNQNLPKVWPWATWADNNSDTRTNTDYEFSFGQDNVADKWQESFFDFSDGHDAATFDYIMVQEDVPNALEARMKLESRPTQDIPIFTIEDNDQHELPVVRKLPSNTHDAAGQSEVPLSSAADSQATVVDRIPRRVSKALQRAETMVWMDEGGLAIRDDGTQITANNIRVAVMGNRLELEG